MDQRIGWTLRVVSAFAFLYLANNHAWGATYTVTVDAGLNTVGGTSALEIPLPSGSANLTIRATGNAQYALNHAFAMLLVEHKEGAISVQREVPIGGEIQVEIADTKSYPLNFFFVDSDPGDNSGLVEIAISGTVTATASVSAMQNCLTDLSSASVLIPDAPCTVSATGNPSFGWGHFANVVLMYPGPLGTRAFRGVEIGAGSTPLPLFEGGEVYLFFADTHLSDNSGSASVVLECAGTIGTFQSSWGAAKALFR